MLSKKSVIYLFICLCSFAYKTWASDAELLKLKFLYDELRFEEAIAVGQNILDEKRKLNRQEYAFVHQYLAFSFFNIGKKDSTYSHFLSLLSLKPDLELDPIETSPKIIEVFNQVKKDLNSLKPDAFPVSQRYVFLDDKRPSAALRSLVIPGWGQYHKNQKSRAYLTAGAAALSVIFTSGSYYYEKQYRNDYLDAVDPDKIIDKYDAYDKWSKRRQIGLYVTAGVWIFSFADALWSDYDKLDIQPAVEKNGYFLHITFAL